MTAPPGCAWCGKPTHRVHYAKKDDIGFSLCCSAKCHKVWMAHRCVLTKAQVEARLAHVAQQPKGCATLEEFLAAGGAVYREAARPHASLGYAYVQPSANLLFRHRSAA